MRITTDGKHKVFELSSVDDAFTEAMRIVRAMESQGRKIYTDQFLKNQARTMRSDLNSWSDLEAARSSVWTEGVTLIEKLRRSIPDQDVDFATTRRRRRSTSMDEGEVNLDNWIAGRCDYFDATSFIKIRNDSQFINLAFSAAAHYGVSGVQCFMQPAAVVAAVDKLESQGHQVQLNLYTRCLGCHNDDDHRTVIVKVKEAGEPVNIESLATAMSPWFFRLVMLTISLRDVVEGRKHREGLSHPCYNFAAIEKYLPEAQNIERSFSIQGMAMTYGQLSTMIQGKEAHG